MNSSADKFAPTLFDPERGCWLWRGRVSTNGYGIGNGGAAHVVAYETSVGPIPPGFDIHHVCGTRSCVNPAHLVALSVTQHRRIHAAAISSCPRGHPYTPENTFFKQNHGGVARVCRTCDRKRAREYCKKRYDTDLAYRVSKGGRP